MQANFTTDKEGGCSPLSIKFTNTTTGASPAATWSWDLGNGNTSALKEPGATYFAEKTYTVTLTVKDGTSASSKKIELTVYKKPIVDFNINKVKGCAPFEVNFTANATAGDGTVSNYLWDFGDGETTQGGSYKVAQHIYTFPQNPPVTLNVTNSYGCYTTLTKNSIVEVVQSVQAGFTTSALTLCNAGESVNFTNTSTGSGALSYKWDFGDGKSSAEASPVHVYDTKGTYTATLTTTSSDGCSDIKKSAGISVANFIADFSTLEKICEDQYTPLANKSTAGFDRAEWFIDNDPYGYISYYHGDYQTTFYEPGDHSVKLVMYYGNCSVTAIKQVKVNAAPAVNGFVAELQGACGVPVTIKYADTTKDAVSWLWQNSYFGNTFATTRNASYNYTSGSDEHVYLTVTNAAGCSAGAAKYINYGKPVIYIKATGDDGYTGCTGLTLNFAAVPDTGIADYKWNLGDGSPVSTEKSPIHTFNKAGYFTVTLDYITKNGCKGSETFNTVRTVDKPDFDFVSKSGTTICGSTPDTINAIPALGTWTYNWSFNGDSYYGYNSNYTVVKQFDYDTTYTVRMIAVNGSCRDTVTKEKYIKVLPPFPRVGQVFNTCDGTRGDVRFTESSMKALKWMWNFGDGGTDIYSAKKDTIRHTYTKTGTYNVVLSATNGACTVKDSVKAYVLLKQNPVLSSVKTDACGSDIVPFKLSGYELNPHPYGYSYDFNISRIEYGDLTASAAITNLYYTFWQKEVSSNLERLDPGKTDLRIITISDYFNCQDTSNFIPLKIHGPAAGFKVEPHSGCFKDPVLFTDTSSKSGSTAIIKWEWDFGDGKKLSSATGGTISHLFSNPGNYYVRLKITDADGCTNTTTFYGNYVNVGGPKADFTASAYNVPPNTTVSFYNSSEFYYYSQNILQWIFSDGTVSSNDSYEFLYTAEGDYIVKLVTKNLITGCTDTVAKTIKVRKVNSVFTYRLSYINNNSCPPVIASFTSTSTNAVRVSWAFGDGGVAGNQLTASHTYNKPGMYRVVHYSYDSNNQVDSTEDYIEVKGPYALLQADTVFGCSALNVKLNATVKYASQYTWDFGDGTVVPTSDTFASHQYLTPGIYAPALILKDAGGCSATSELASRIIVDSLSVSFTTNPPVICDAATTMFNAQVVSLSNQQMQSNLQYTWTVNENNQPLVISNQNATYTFTKVGIHPVSLVVTSPYGCYQTVNKAVEVKEAVHASVTGLAKVCQGDTVIFTGSGSSMNTALQWKWDFDNGSTSNDTKPSPQVYTEQGSHMVSLILTNGFCSDTIYHPLNVDPHPAISFTPANLYVCKGSSIQVTAAGGVAYQWEPGEGIINVNNTSITVQPVTASYYKVKVTDAAGCSSNDSVYVQVIDTVNVSLPPSAFACEGNSLKLGAAGADKYQWINYTEGLSSIAVAAPSVLTKISAIYTVVGYDEHNCFTDTASIAVRISKLPLVNAGQDKETIAGTQVALDGNVTGAANWNWSPSAYLSCTNCITPSVKPATSLTYILTAYNADGCLATDEVRVRMICKNNLVYIPNAFSPNNDGLNERFVIKGSGIKTIRHMVVYNRWGKKIFEGKNLGINDVANSWDGTCKGEPAAVGSYVYFIQTECEGGDIFNYRGTLLLTR
ncbi:MAG: PKD domain-containing protein [Ferruginibacter sp.]